MRLIALAPHAGHCVGERWRVELERLFGPGVSVAPDPEFRRGELFDWPVSGARLLDARSDGQQLRRSAIGDEHSAMLSLLLQVEGPAELGRSGTMSVEPGTALVLDAGSEMDLSLPRAYRQLILLVPRTSLLKGVSAAHALSSGDAVDAKIIDAMQTLARGPELSLATRRALAVAIACSLPASTLAREQLGAVHVRVRRALAQIELEFADPQLSPSTVADAQGVSRRHLDALVARQGTSLACLIRERRLAEAARLLRAPTHASHTILAVAQDTGFRSAAHFSRVFRAHFDTSPSAWRRGSFARSWAGPQ